MTNIAEKLGLDASATEEDILAAIDLLLSDKTDAEDEAVEAIMNRHADQIPADKQAEIREALVLNRAVGLTMLQLLPQPKKAAEVSILNRATGKDAISDGDDEATNALKQKRRADRIMNRAAEMRGAIVGLTFEESYKRAERAIDSEDSQ